VSWLAALLIVVSYLATEDWRNRPWPASLEEALKSGESQAIELKGGRPEVPLKRAIAAFANTNSGTIFIGIDDKGAITGVDCDTAQKKDEQLQRIRNIATQSIKPAVSVNVDFIAHQGKTIMRIFVPRGERPLYFLENEIYVREQSSSMKATPDQVERILRKFNRAS
jgi:ATP-dependent DNA helicase RecG